VLKHCAANRKRRLSALPNVGLYIDYYIHDVKISGFTRSSIYIYIYIYTTLVGYGLNSSQGGSQSRSGRLLENNKISYSCGGGIEPMIVHLQYHILNLYLGHHAVPFLREFPPNRCMHFSTSHACHIPHPSYSTRPRHSINITWGARFMGFLTLETYPSFCYSLPLWCKYFPNHPVLERPQNMLFLQKSYT
jgi:hypothetical protein